MTCIMTSNKSKGREQRGGMKFNNGTTNDLNVKTTEQVVKYVKLLLNVYRLNDTKFKSNKLNKYYAILTGLRRMCVSSVSYQSHIKDSILFYYFSHLLHTPCPLILLQFRSEVSVTVYVNKHNLIPHSITQSRLQ